MTNPNKNTILSIVIAVVVLGGIAGLVFIGSKQQKAATDSWKAADSTNPSALVADESLFDFGTISMAAGNVNRVFTIKNAGSNAVKITSVYTSCMCTTAVLLKGNEKWGPFGMPGHGRIPEINVPVGPEEEVSVEVKFDPTAHGPAGIGRTERIVYLENTSGAPLELWIKATVTP